MKRLLLTLSVFVSIPVEVFSLRTTGLPTRFPSIHRTTKVNLFPELFDAHQSISSIINFENIDSLGKSSLWLADEANNAATTAANIYSKVDKTGFIGFIATYIEIAITNGKDLFNYLGLQNSYGCSIILFTLLVKALTLPLVYQQLASTAKIQQLNPLQQKIQQRFENDPETRSRLLTQLFQAAQVNPLAGCLPALVQIPIFISLYRALTNLVAEKLLSEPFLWIPNLQGPVFALPSGESSNWIVSIFSGKPVLGWHDTLCYLSIPLILYISQSISSKLLTPPRDPNRAMTEQEEITMTIIGYLPLIVAFFSINVPAALGVYWVVNNILTTVITLTIKKSFKEEPFPPEVDQLLALAGLDMSSSSSSSSAAAATGSSSSKLMETMNTMKSVVDDKPKPEGFSSKKTVVDESNTNSDDDDGTSKEEALVAANTKKSNKNKKSKRRN